MRRTHAIKADVLIHNSELKLVKVVFISLLLLSAQIIKLDGILISNEGVRKEIVYVRVAHTICDGEIEEIRESTSDSHLKVNQSYCKGSSRREDYSAEPHLKVRKQTGMR